MATASQTPTKVDLHRELARQLRADSIRCSTAAGSGHPTSSLSAADLIAVLLAGHLRYDFGQPDNPANDHLIFSKGHASPLLYSVVRPSVWCPTRNWSAPTAGSDPGWKATRRRRCRGST